MASASHKANFNVDTTDIPSIPTRGDGLHPPVVNPDAPAGSLIIFLEATLRECRNGLLASSLPPPASEPGWRGRLYAAMAQQGPCAALAPLP